MNIPGLVKTALALCLTGGGIESGGSEFMISSITNIGNSKLRVRFYAHQPGVVYLHRTADFRLWGVNSEPVARISIEGDYEFDFSADWPHQSIRLQWAGQDGAQIFKSGFEQEGAGIFLATVDGWKVESGGVQVVGDGWEAAEGKHSLDVGGIASWDPGIIYRDIPTVVGRQYRLRFAFGKSGESDPVEIKVFWSGVEIAGLSRIAEDWAWAYHEYTLIATSTTSRLKFQTVNFMLSNPLIDDISLVEVN